MADPHPTYTIFYSWQSDSSRKYNWTLIEDALSSAIESIKSAPTVPMIPNLDFGMEGISGSPEIATIMFRKIKSAAIFVGDVSAVGLIQTSKGESKKTANPNVMVEMGFAAGTIGWERIICVMNEYFGKIEELPIDVRNKRYPIRYKLSPENKDDKDKVQSKLAEDLKKAIEVVVFNDYQATIDAERKFDANCIQVISVFRTKPYFYAPQPGTFSLGSADGIDTVTINTAIPRLLDLGLIYCDFDSRQNLYAYHWTVLGLMFLKRKWPNDPLPVQL